jgi:hypothetical protein
MGFPRRRSSRSGCRCICERRRESGRSCRIGGRCAVSAARDNPAATARRPPSVGLFRRPLRPNNSVGVHHEIHETHEMIGVGGPTEYAENTELWFSACSVCSVGNLPCDTFWPRAALGKMQAAGRIVLRSSYSFLVLAWRRRTRTRTRNENENENEGIAAKNNGPMKSLRSGLRTAR